MGEKVRRTLSWMSLLSPTFGSADWSRSQSEWLRLRSPVQAGQLTNGANADQWNKCHVVGNTGPRAVRPAG